MIYNLSIKKTKKMETTTKFAFSQKFGEIEFDGLEGDFSTDNYIGELIPLSACGKDELLAILKSSPYYSTDAIQSYFNECFNNVDWSKFNGDYKGLISSTLDDKSGGINVGGFEFYFSN